MNKIVLLFLLVFGSMTTQAQELTWETNINKAIEVSNKTNKPLLLFFTGSDWCGWCIRLQKEVLKFILPSSNFTSFKVLYKKEI